MKRLTAHSVAMTNGVRVEVSSQYVEAQSLPPHRYVFAYQVTIQNDSERAVQLQTRHWVITHGDGEVEEVRGPGVVGQQPLLQPGQRFRYQSGAILRTPRGQMEGAYQLVVADTQEPFDAVIAPFALEAPYSLN